MGCIVSIGFFKSVSLKITTHQIAIIRRCHVIERVAIFDVHAGVVGITSPSNFTPHFMEVSYRVEVDPEIGCEVVVQLELIRIELRFVVEDVVARQSRAGRAFSVTITVAVTVCHFVIVAGIHVLSLFRCTNYDLPSVYTEHTLCPSIVFRCLCMRRADSESDGICHSCVDDRKF